MTEDNNNTINFDLGAYSARCRSGATTADHL